MNGADTAQKAAMRYAFEMCKGMFSDPAILDYFAQAEVDRLIAAGDLVRAEDLDVGAGRRMVPAGYQVVPKSTLERVRFELDELRTMVAEHLAGNDHTEALTDLLESGIDVSRPFSDDVEIVDARPPRTEPVADATPSAPSDDPDAHRRPKGCPRPGEQVPCQTCGQLTPDPDKGEDPDQAILSYIRWSVPQCLADHRALSQEMRR